MMQIIWERVEGTLCGDINPKGKQGCCDFFFLYCYEPWLAR